MSSMKAMRAWGAVALGGTASVFIGAPVSAASGFRIELGGFDSEGAAWQITAEIARESFVTRMEEGSVVLFSFDQSRSSGQDALGSGGSFQMGFPGDPIPGWDWPITADDIGNFIGNFAVSDLFSGDVASLGPSHPWNFWTAVETFPGQFWTIHTEHGTLDPFPVDLFLQSISSDGRYEYAATGIGDVLNRTVINHLGEIMMLDQITLDSIRFTAAPSVLVPAPGMTALFAVSAIFARRRR